MNNYKVIDVKKRIRKVQFEWFNTFEDPTYGFNVKIDVTEIVNYSKKTNTSFFANFFYVVMLANNNCEPMRLRIVDNEVRLYEEIHPDFTVKTDDGSFNNVCFDYSSNYQEFYKACRKTIEANNKKMILDKDYNNNQTYNRVYSSCLTTIDIEGMVHPIKARDVEGNSVPRIFWCRYVQEGEKYTLLLNTTVNHALVDGEDLSKYFQLVREYSKNFLSLIK